MAAGTIAEVHRATLTTGERVVVKVQRPTARAGHHARPRPAEDVRRQDRRPAGLPRRSSTCRPSSSTSPRRCSASWTSDRRPRTSRGWGRPGARIRGSTCRRSRRSTPARACWSWRRSRACPSARLPRARPGRRPPASCWSRYYRQILTDGFFHADPHPGNLLWWNDTIYFLDFGMVGELGPEMRELLVLMLMAFWQEDVPFLSDVVLMIAGEDQRADIDLDGGPGELGDLMARIPQPVAERAAARPDPAGDHRDLHPARRPAARLAGPDREGPGPDAAGHGAARSHPRPVLGGRAVPDQGPAPADAGPSGSRRSSSTRRRSCACGSSG